MRPHPLTLLVLVAAVAGFAFAAVSTYDFVQHLDRDVHGLHCSFFPGLGDSNASLESGCGVTLMSPYSSVLRSTIWGGIPVSLPAMGVFGFIAFWCIVLIATNREQHLRPAAFLFAASLVPAVTSVVMGYLSLATLDAVCKICVGIYVSSALAFLGSLFLFLRGKSEDDLALLQPRHVPREGTYDESTDSLANRRAPAPPTPMGWGVLIAAFFLGVLFVMVPVSAYALTAPDFSKYIGSCGTLEQSAGETPDGVFLPLGPRVQGVPMLEVLDPLCPSCRGFERRLSGLEISEKLTRRVVLFPLDDECNWMVDKAIHPGACAVSEAMLCAADRAQEVLEWAFAEQEHILEAAKLDRDAARKMVSQHFPELASCVGTPAARARLNLALRWAVERSLPLLTPQIYVGETRVCAADTDLGMDFMITKLVERTPPGPPPPPYPVIEPGSYVAPTPAPRRDATSPAPSGAAPSGAAATAASAGAAAEATPSGNAPAPQVDPVPNAEAPTPSEEPKPNENAALRTAEPGKPPATDPAKPTETP